MNSDEAQFSARLQAIGPFIIAFALFVIWCIEGLPPFRQTSS